MATTETHFRTVKPQELFERCRKGESIELIDVRTPAEFRELHAVYARNIPLDSLDPAEVTHGRSADDPIYVICRSGNRSTKACEAFLGAAFTNVINVEGGTTAWEQAGLPVERGRKTISLERQVRIAAGSLVAVGSVLGFFVHPYWLAIPAFVGCGLVFAGVTDTCGMGMLLARMPWNRAGGSDVVKPAAKTESQDSAGGDCCSG